MIINEIDNMKYLHHRNIVKFYDVQETQSSIYCFMEFCDGGHFEKKIKELGSIP